MSGGAVPAGWFGVRFVSFISLLNERNVYVRAARVLAARGAPAEQVRHRVREARRLNVAAVRDRAARGFLPPSKPFGFAVRSAG